MATVDDYIGKICPYCGATDSMEADEARGEVACVNCASVVAMGLEENVLTRFNKDATFADADQDAWDPEVGGGKEGVSVGRATVRTAGLSREEAAAAAAGVLLRSVSATDSSEAAKYAKTTLHPRMSRQLENLFRLSRRCDEAILRDGIEIAKYFVGYRRERSVRVEHQNEVAAACLMIAAELRRLPIPLAEMRVLDSSLKDIESRRHEVLQDTKMTAKVERVKSQFVPNLIRYYIELMHLQILRYEKPCLALFEAIRICAAKTDDSRVSELTLLVEAEKAVMAVLLARTEQSIQWSSKPPYNPATDPPVATVHSSFAASAHLQSQRVTRIMRAAEKPLQLITEEFSRLILLPAFASTDVILPGSAPASQAMQQKLPATASIPSSTHPHPGAIGIKRERSFSPPAPQ